MIDHNKSKNVKYRLIKTNTLFGLDWKSQFKMNNCSFFICKCRIVEKTCKNGSKITKNVPKYLVFDIIGNIAIPIGVLTGFRYQ